MIFMSFSEARSWSHMYSGPSWARVQSKMNLTQWCWKN